MECSSEIEIPTKMPQHAIGGNALPSANRTSNDVSKYQHHHSNSLLSQSRTREFQPQQPNLMDGSLSERSSQSSRKNKRRKQRRPIFLEISESLKQAHTQRHPWDFVTGDTFQEAYDTPDFNHLSQLTFALFICSLFTVVAGWDAKEQCLSNEDSVVVELADDDNIQQAYEKSRIDEKCILLFRYVMLPTGGILCGLSLVALAILSRYRSSNEYNSPTCGWSWKNAVRSTVALAILFLLMLVVQTYNICQIMLEPKLQHHDDDVFMDNPYQSLAAVDTFGQVGDNANLYYLSWLCQVLVITLAYQSATSCFRVCRAARHDNSSALLAAPSWTSDRTMRKQNRAAWYSSLYKLRVRTGVWTAACVTCVVIVASSQYIWAQVLALYVQRIRYHRSIGRAIIDSRNYPVCTAASQLSKGYFSAQLCRRTMTAWISGWVAAFLCFTAVASHLAARYGSSSSSDNPMDHHDFYHDHNLMELLADREFCGTSPSKPRKRAENLLHRYYSFHHPKRLSLRTELALAVVLSLLLGINAVLVTGVQGPAATVGNLYYASWLAFLLCVRICLGCVEEFYNIDDEDNEEESLTEEQPTSLDESESGGYNPSEIDCANTVENKVVQDQKGTKAIKPCISDQKPPQHDAAAQTIEKKRRGRVRGYFFLAIFSLVCTASAYDAGANQKTNLSKEQLYMTIAPFVVGVIATLCFFVSLSKPCYSILRKFMVGGVLAVLCCGIWLGNLVLTMHSEKSWAVNGIGEIETANLYYFSWASMITSGISMTSYLKGLFNIKKLDHMSTVWVVICKVCFVILGAALHVWHTISDNCEFDEITSGAVTFCSRTVLAICVSLTGLTVGGLVVLIRFLLAICPCCKCANVQAHAEMLLSLFLTLLFVAAVAMITGIGGPGQSVGDLYYSTWLAFWVSLGVFQASLKQLQEEETE